MSYHQYNNYVPQRTDKYFDKTRGVISKFGDVQVTYGIFLRRECIVAVRKALLFLEDYCPTAKVTLPYAEGTLVPSETKIMIVEGSFKELVIMETQLLQHIGFSCISAYNAYKMCMAMKEAPFMDMHARHGCGEDMNHLCAYGASVGSRMAKLQGAKGFIGSSQDITAPYYGQTKGMGTMPHALIGYCGSTTTAMRMYMDTYPEEKNIAVLVDYYGREISDSLACASEFSSAGKHELNTEGKTLLIRLDTHGGRFAEDLNYERSVEVVCNWLHAKDEYDAVKRVMGEEAYDMDSLNITKDKVRKLLFGTGVSVANVVNLRTILDAHGYKKVKIIGSSGFNMFKCKIFGTARAPLDMIGTGSFLPESLSETYATADIYKYDDNTSVKVGREWLIA